MPATEKRAGDAEVRHFVTREVAREHPGRQSRGEVQDDGRWTGGVCRRRYLGPPSPREASPPPATLCASALRAQRCSLLSCSLWRRRQTPREASCGRFVAALPLGRRLGRAADLAVYDARPDRGGGDDGQDRREISLEIRAERRRPFLFFRRLVGRRPALAALVRERVHGRSLRRAKFWRPVLGNHDYDGNATAQLLYPKKHWHFPSAQYSWRETLEDDGRTTVDFVMLDTILLCGPDSAVDRKVKGAEKAWRWVEAALAGSDADYLVVSGHYPVWSPSSHGPTRCLVRRLQPLLTAAKRLGLLLRPRPLPVPRRRARRHAVPRRRRRLHRLALDEEPESDPARPAAQVPLGRQHEAALQRALRRIRRLPARACAPTR